MPQKTTQRKGKASRPARGPASPPSSGTGRTAANSAEPTTSTSKGDKSLDDDVGSLRMEALTLTSTTGTQTAAPAKEEKSVKQKPFRFLDLPPELRAEVYLWYFEGIDHVDLDSDNYKRIHKKLGIFRTCRIIRQEAPHAFYSFRTFRIFPTQPGRHFKTKRPLLARLNERQRRLLTSLELRLGPGWNKPPRGWVVNSALGLSDCVNVRKLTVFVECDPSDNAFKGFRQYDGFYENFSRNLLDEVLGALPTVRCVYFDAWSSVKKSGAMMAGLLDVAEARGRTIRWGPERKWTD
ncbi:hypothetical protein B0J18DRAFT_61 [Chaetomium sp. MPI-SDFR-AT-0129]|nr:hypothetical protein B0J18DRAFT_61 [Chaetomium sp. MPI-SDFR-AT-0129]